MKMFGLRALLFLMVVLILPGRVVADDIEVFSKGGGVKPNILFVFDRSGSMQFDLEGNATTTAADRRGRILQDALKKLLAENRETINAGLGPFYQRYTTGVKWPIGDLTQNAHQIDAGIPQDDDYTSEAIINKIYEQFSDWGGTNLVDSLYESALYFRGEQPWVRPGSPDYVFRPDTWRTDWNGFERGDALAPHKATYSPQDAYNNEAIQLDPYKGTCKDYSIGGTATGANYCDHSSFASYDNCRLIPMVPGQPDVCISYEWQCNETNSDGQCVDNKRVCTATGQGPDQPAYNLCDYVGIERWGPEFADAKYVSPITASCQPNFIVLLSDGDPTENTSSDLIKEMTGKAECEDLSTSLFSETAAGDASDANCGIELAEYLANNDQIDTIPESIVKTYTVGFANEGPGQTFLKKLADAGGGEFYPAQDSNQLTSAFNSILSSISSTVETFSAVSVEIDKATFSTGEKAFFSLFQPSHQRSWPGNLKGYFLDKDGLEDVTGAPATEQTEAGTIFSAASQSFWSSSPDGADISAGGASTKLGSTSRNLLTYTGDYDFGFGADLTHEDHKLDILNDNITTDLLGGHPHTVIDWLQGAPMADPLHTQPVTVNYSDQTVVYTMTNQGLLHAIEATNPISRGDLSGGMELWAFMPQELLANLGDLSAEYRPGPHIYGLDGGMTLWLQEKEDTANGVIDAGEDAILFIGMRRGGSNYYAIDVSNPNSPTLLWKLGPDDPDFENLGQSWSRMALSTMRENGVERKVLIFGGGYDPYLDGSDIPIHVTDTNDPIRGNDVFIVDALSGDLLWSAYEPFLGDMRYSIPADIRVLDVDSDGIADRLYFGDLGGQLWRVDFKDGDVAHDDGISIHRLAEFGASNDYHPFFYPPSIANMRTYSEHYFAVAVGSGSRDNPLNPYSSNAVFVVKDRNTAVGEASDVDGWPFNLDDLYNTTDNTINSDDKTVVKEERAKMRKADGWYIKLLQGEKVLSQTSIFQNQLLFTTYAPSAQNDEDDDSACKVVGSIGSYFRIDVRDGGPVVALSSDTPGGVLTTDDRSKIVTSHGIPGPATIVFPTDTAEVLVYVGQDKVEAIEQELVKSLWWSN